MSMIADCPACMTGKHEGHDPRWGLRHGLIGGYYCACDGGCKSRAEEIVERLSRVLMEAQP